MGNNNVCKFTAKRDSSCCISKTTFIVYFSPARTIYFPKLFHLPTDNIHAQVGRGDTTHNAAAQMNERWDNNMQIGTVRKVGIYYVCKFYFGSVIRWIMQRMWVFGCVKTVTTCHFCYLFKSARCHCHCYYCYCRCQARPPIVAVNEKQTTHWLDILGKRLWANLNDKDYKICWWMTNCNMHVYNFSLCIVPKLYLPMMELDTTDSNDSRELL